MSVEQPQDRTIPWLESGRGDGVKPYYEPDCYSQGTYLYKELFMTKTILVCPKCKSKDITPLAGFVTGFKYHCRDCGYKGVLILEMDVE